MASFDDIGINILVTRHTGVRADVETAEISQARRETHGVSPICSRVTAQPGSSCVVATFTRNALVGVRSRSQPGGGYRLKGRVTNGATIARLRCRQRKRLRDSRRAGVDQDGVRSRVKVLLRPCEILASLFTSAAVATGRFATNGSDKLINLELRGIRRGGIPSQINGDSRASRQPVRCAPVHSPELSGELRSDTR